MDRRVIFPGLERSHALVRLRSHGQGNIAKGVVSSSEMVRVCLYFKASIGL
jgi:hypothetical protein